MQNSPQTCFQQPDGLKKILYVYFYYLVETEELLSPKNGNILEMVQDTDLDRANDLQVTYGILNNMPYNRPISDDHQ